MPTQAPLLLLILLLLSQTSLTTASQLPHIIVMLMDDFGFANVGYHRTPEDDPHHEVQTPFMDELVSTGLRLDRFYVHKFCSPTRSALQTGRSPYLVNVENSDIGQSNPEDPISGFQGIPRNMTGLATKLKEMGYSTHQVGKWHAGMATPDHTPQGRGYDTSLLYFDAANGYWDNLPEGGSSCPGLGELTDLWASGQPAHGLNNSRLCSQANQAPSCKYEDELFAEHMVAAIAGHNASGGPFFGFAAWHNCHAPPEVPAPFLANFSAFIPVPARAMYAAKANYLDAQIGKVVVALKAAGMYDSTLIWGAADNGGPLGSANNWPLKGGKFSNWEGGVRVNAFVSGGALPPARRGGVEGGFMGVADIYPTLCALAGADPVDARGAAAGLPPVDGHNMWPLLSGASPTSPRVEVVLGDTVTGAQVGATSVQGYINASSGLKVLVGEVWWSAWPGPQSPVAGGPTMNVTVHCTPACLFDVINDPTERKDLAKERPDVVAAMLLHLQGLNRSAFSPDRGTRNASLVCAAAAAYGGFLGPFLP